MTKLGTNALTFNVRDLQHGIVVVLMMDLMLL